MVQTEISNMLPPKAVISLQDTETFKATMDTEAWSFWDRREKAVREDLTYFTKVPLHQNLRQVV